MLQKHWTMMVSLVNAAARVAFNWKLKPQQYALGAMCNVDAAARLRYSQSLYQSTV